MSLPSKILVIIQVLSLTYLSIWGTILTSGWLLLLQLFGIALGIWGIWVMKIGNFNIQPEVKAKAVLVSTGPYALIRNPMYTGLIVFFGSGVLYSLQFMNLMVYFLLVVVLLLKINMEEKFMTKQFGQTYVLYKNKTYRLFPYLF